LREGQYAEAFDGIINILKNVKHWSKNKMCRCGRRLTNHANTNICKLCRRKCCVVCIKNHFCSTCQKLIRHQ